MDSMILIYLNTRLRTYVGRLEWSQARYRVWIPNSSKGRELRSKRGGVGVRAKFKFDVETEKNE